MKSRRLQLRLQLIWCFVLIFGMEIGTPANSMASTESWPPVCGSLGRKLKNCKVGLKKLHVQLWQEKIFVNDGINRSLIEFPIKGDDVSWDLVQLRTIGAKQFLEVKVWDTRDTKSDLQAMHWMLYEVTPSLVTLKVDEVIQRRKVSQSTTGKTKYSYDRQLATNVRAHKNEIEWSAGPKKGKIQ